MREENRSEIIQDALAYLDDDMLEEVDKMRQNMQIEEIEQSSNGKNKIFSRNNIKNKRKWVSLAASICVLVLGSWMLWDYVVLPEDIPHKEDSTKEESVGIDVNQSIERPENEQEDTVNDLSEEFDDSRGTQEVQGAPESQKTQIVIPPMEVNLQKQEGIAADMLALFIYQGRCYVQCELIDEDIDFVGEKVGTVNGLIDEWTEADGYVDGAGTFTGTIYEVKGVSPEFMLCTIWDNGVVETYVHNNGITLTKGSDLLDKWLNLREEFANISFQTDQEYTYTQKDAKTISNEYQDLFSRFLDSFAENSFIYRDRSLSYPSDAEIDNSHIYHLYFTKENGLRLHFILMGDGYVYFPGLYSVCVQIDQAVYEEVIDTLEKEIR